VEETRKILSKTVKGVEGEMPSIYDQIRELYDCLRGDDVKRAKEILKNLVKKGVDKEFIRANFTTLAIEKMIEHLYDEATKAEKTPP